jgi:hypothetical protein
MSDLATRSFLAAVNSEFTPGPPAPGMHSVTFDGHHDTVRGFKFRRHWQLMSRRLGPPRELVPAPQGSVGCEARPCRARSFGTGPGFRTGISRQWRNLALSATPIRQSTWRSVHDSHSFNVQNQEEGERTSA